jgi:hypothetical protein
MNCGSSVVARLIEDAIRDSGLDVTLTQGCSQEELHAAADDQGLESLPPAYATFLHHVGHAPYDSPARHLFEELFQNLDFSYEALMIGDPEDSSGVLAQHIADLANSDVRFRGRRCVFLQHEGHIVSYIDGLTDDAPVMEWTGHDPEPKKLADNFCDWLRDQIEFAARCRARDRQEWGEFKVQYPVGIRVAASTSHYDSQGLHVSLQFTRFGGVVSFDDLPPSHRRPAGQYPPFSRLDLVIASYEDDPPHARLKLQPDSATT